MGFRIVSVTGRASSEFYRVKEAGKPDGLDGSQVEAYFNGGRIQEIADYCRSDVINTYRLWLQHVLFHGRLDQGQFELSERCVVRDT